MERPTQTRPPSEPVALRDEEAPDFLEAHRVALLAFLAEGDEPSERVRPRLAMVAASLARPELGVGVLDVRTDARVASALGVRDVPTLFVFVEGEVVDRLGGAVPEAVLAEALRARL